MSTDELLSRLRRLYAAVGALEEFDLGKFPAKVTSTGFYQDFSGGLDDAQVENLAHTAIYLVAHLDYHLRRWAKQDDKGQNLIQQDLAKSDAFALVKDLANLDKHGPERSKGHSGKSPRLLEIKRVLRLQTGPTAGSGVFGTFHPTGPKVRGSSGSKAFVIVDGRIVDRSGATVADLHGTLSKAVDDVDALMKRLGVPA